MECSCHLRNFHDDIAGKTAFEERLGEEFDGPLIPFGSLVEHVSISAEDKSRVHQCGQKD